MKQTTLSGSLPRRYSFVNFLVVKRNAIIETISALFILLFLYTAINKSFDIHSTIIAIKKAPLVSSFPKAMAWIVVMAEYAISILLFLPITRKIGLYSTACLMTVFTAYIGYMKIFATRLPCSCGGVISRMTWNQHLLFNLLFLLLALSAILFEKKARKQDMQINIETVPIVFT